MGGAAGRAGEMGGGMEREGWRERNREEASERETGEGEVGEREGGERERKRKRDRQKEKVDRLVKRCACGAPFRVAGNLPVQLIKNAMRHKFDFMARGETGVVMGHTQLAPAQSPCLSDND